MPSTNRKPVQVRITVPAEINLELAMDLARSRYEQNEPMTKAQLIVEILRRHYDAK